MAIRFEKLRAGMTLYDVHSERMGNTTMRRTGVWTATVKEIDEEGRRALISWNGNRASWESEYAINKTYRANPPEWLRRDMFEMRRRSGRFYCYLCGAVTDDKKDRSKHEETCTHPRAVAYRKKRDKAARQGDPDA